MSLRPSYPELIQPLAACIGKAVEGFSSSVEGNQLHFSDEAARRELINAAEKLLIAARSPEENVFTIAQQVRTTQSINKSCSAFETHVLTCIS